jgi:hypothetical protein
VTAAGVKEQPTDRDQWPRSRIGRVAAVLLRGRDEHAPAPSSDLLRAQLETVAAQVLARKLQKLHAEESPLPREGGPPGLGSEIHVEEWKQGSVDQRAGSRAAAQGVKWPRRWRCRFRSLGQSACTGVAPEHSIPGASAGRQRSALRLSGRAVRSRRLLTS